MIRIPNNPGNAKIILNGNYDESWNDDSPEAFRHHVAEKLGGYLNTIFASSVSNYPV